MSEHEDTPVIPPEKPLRRGFDLPVSLAVNEESNWSSLPNQLALDAQAIGAFYHTVMKRIRRDIPLTQQAMVAFGARLLAAEKRYPSTKAFGAWIRDNGLDKLDIGRDRAERGACMILAKLVLSGAVFEEGLPGVPLTFEQLKPCPHIGPSNTVNWLRKHPDYRKLVLYRDGPEEGRRKEAAHGAFRSDRKVSEVDRLQAELDERYETIDGYREKREDAMAAWRRGLALELADEYTGIDAAFAFLQPLYEEGGADALKSLIAVADTILESHADQDENESAETVAKRRAATGRLTWHRRDDNEVAGYNAWFDHQDAEQTHYSILPVPTKAGDFSYYEVCWLVEDTILGKTQEVAEAKAIAEEHAMNNPEDES